LSDKKKLRQQYNKICRTLKNEMLSTNLAIYMCLEVEQVLNTGMVLSGGENK
jgi:hypothetical protein